MAITRIQKWGNSYGIRIPKNIMDEMGLRPDTHLEIHQEQGKIALTPLQETRVSLDELLGQITSENLHGEMDWGASTGRDAW